MKIIRHDTKEKRGWMGSTCRTCGEHFPGREGSFMVVHGGDVYEMEFSEERAAAIVNGAEAFVEIEPCTVTP